MSETASLPQSRRKSRTASDRHMGRLRARAMAVMAEQTPGLTGEWDGLLEDDPDAAAAVVDHEDRAAEARVHRLADAGDLVTGQARHAVEGEPAHRHGEAEVHDTSAVVPDLDPERRRCAGQHLALARRAG